MTVRFWHGPKDGLRASVCLGVVIWMLLPDEVANQDLDLLLARQAPVVDRTIKGSLVASLGTAHEANLSPPRPLGAAIPAPLGYALVGLETNHAAITGAIRERILQENAALSAPMVDRSGKADYRVFEKSSRVLARKGDFGGGHERSVAATRDRGPGDGGNKDAIERTVTAAANPVAAPPRERALAPPEVKAKPRRLPAPPVVVTRAEPPSAPAEPSAPAAGGGFSLASAKATQAPADLAYAAADVDPGARAARIYFGIDPMGQKLGSIEPWTPGHEPILELADAALSRDGFPASASGNIRLAALPPSEESGIFRDAPIERADLPPLPAPSGGQTVAPKGEVTGADQRPMTPAQRLNLDEQSRAKEEKCLAEVIYFEARGEPVRGQMAVAQVVLNRAFSGKYPSTVCGVVYQNAHRYLACQFTFACDRHRDVVREPDMWERAKVIAAEMLDGQLWLPEVGKATHYHAYWVRPGWAREMTKLHKLGVHTFYRPRKWGDGGDAPQWGDETSTTESAKRLVEAARSSKEQTQ